MHATYNANENSMYPKCTNSRKSHTHENIFSMLHKVSKRLIELAEENVTFNEYWKRWLSKIYQAK